ncbi:MAG: hypothetical protein KKA73_26890 [Chloroflexi bacterium]|nr:hypothetical protein [Chloroflexota bacterium]MBU1751327.1 hypothetical protein [Chloroflexota bacterium]MBU1877913.1 hypothetical protein [Chloroflexota bacterium]
MSGEERRYFSYLLRLWEASDDEGSVWRALLESPGTGERRGFASLDALFAFLAEQAGGCPTDQPGHGPGTESVGRLVER